MLVSVPDSESEHALVLMIHKAAGDSRNDFLNWCSFLSCQSLAVCACESAIKTRSDIFRKFVFNRF